MLSPASNGDCKCLKHDVFICLLQNHFHLKCVALLCDLSRLHFTLESIHAGPLDNNQLADGNLFQTEFGNTCGYTVRVKFYSEITGFFSQRVIFDFGFRPVVGRTVNVNMHNTAECRERVLSLQQQLQLARWTDDNCNIVAFEPPTVSADLNAELLERYKLPSDINAIINTETITNELNKHNYAHRMHSLLLLEEYTRMNIISQ